jgi:hypothetical protein
VALLQGFRAAALPQLVLATALITATPGAARTGAAVASPRSATGANVWVDVNGGSCKRHDSATKYADAQACGSLQAAFSAAHSGDTVNIAAGTYGRQVLPGETKRVTFRATGSQRPKFGQLVVAASNVTFRGITIEERGIDRGSPCGFSNAVLHPCGSNDVFDNVIVDGLNTPGTNVHAIRGVGPGFVLRNSEIRNIVDNKGFEGGSNGMVIENNYWHDIKLVTPGVHNECMYVDGGDGSIIRGNRFIRCPTMALFFTNYNGGPAYKNVLVENNLFGHTLNNEQRWHDGCSFYLAGGQNSQNTVFGWVVRYNTFEVPPCLDPTPPGGDNGAGRWYGNLGSDGRCIPEFVFRYNVGETCGGAGEIAVARATNDSTHPSQAPFYVNAPKDNFQLHTGSMAINRGDPDTFPLRDGNLRNRLVGSAPDAGAYEFNRRSATTGILAIGSRIDRRLSSGVRSFEQQNPASLALALANSSAAWKSTFAWLHGAGIRVSGASGHYVRRLRSVQLIVLGSHGVTPAETNWLTRTLAHKTALVRIVVVRDPPVLCGSGASAAVRRWGPLFQRYGVRLVISGGGAGGIGTCAGADAARNVTGTTRGFVYVTVDVGGVVVRAVDASGKTIARARVG